MNECIDIDFLNYLIFKYLIIPIFYTCNLIFLYYLVEFFSFVFKYC